MKEHARSRETTASPDRIWSIWSDPSTWGEWNPNVQNVTLNGAFADGATGTMTTKSGGTHQIRLADVRPRQGFRLETQVLPLTRFAFVCRIIPGPAGRTTISQSLAMSGPLAPVFSPMMGGQVAKTFEPLLEGLAKKAEGRS
jgi:hypothetical protein